MKDLRYLLQAFAGLAAWVKAVIALLCATTLIGIGAFFGPRAALFVFFAVLALALLWLVFFLVTSWVRRRRAAEMKGELVSTAAHRGVVDPAARGRLEDLRRNFARGLERFEAAGRDLYDLPWYLIVGEPGAGKTEAIRRSEVGFPPGLQDDYQGVGGTINMNWWFTNHAVVLDTAGRLLFEEVEPGTTDEWSDFLALLKRHRPNCPLNGLLLAIPVDSLLRDTPEELERKAGRIARQLEAVQKQLDVRFPAFVILTKADLLNGFREFFEGLDVASQQQMLGWSNPAPLDAPFRPEGLTAHLGVVGRRLRERRDALLADPVAVNAGTRRADEVDGVFEFPANLEALAPRIARYLEIVFVAGRWTSRPLFFRGLYFTSSLREGAALDAALAEALRVPVASLPEGRAWERERAFFLKDVFLDKVFREDGLVTRALDVERLLLRRKLFLFGGGTVALLALLAFGLSGYRALRDHVYAQTGFWARATEGWQGSAWQPVVVPSGSRPGLWDYRGTRPVGPGLTAATREVFHRSDLSLAQYHEALRELASEPLGVPVVFRPLTFWGSDPDRERVRAQRIVFESGVIKPLLAAARQKMATPAPAGQPFNPDGRSPDRIGALEARALAALVRLEATIVKPPAGLPEFGETVLNPLLEYVTDARDPGTLAGVMAWTYGDNPDGRGTWAPAWMSGGTTLAENASVRVGLERLLNDSRARLARLGSDLQRLNALAAAVHVYQNVETALAAKAGVKNDPETSDREVAAGLDKLQSSKAAMEEKLAAVRQAGLFEDGPETLLSAYGRLTAGSRSRFGQLTVIADEIERVLPTPKPDEKGTAKVLAALPADDRRYALLRDVQAKVAEVTQSLKRQLDGAVSETQLADFKALDGASLEEVNGHPAYLARWDLYQACRAGAPEQHFNDRMILLNGNWRPVQSLAAALAALQAKVEDYQGAMREPLAATCAYLIARADQTQKQTFAANYLRQAKLALRQALRFPLLWPPAGDRDALNLEQLKQAKALVGMIHRDLGSDAFNAIPAASRQALAEFTKGLDPLLAFTDAVLRPDGSLCSVVITLVNGQAQRQLSGPDLAPAPTPPPPGAPPRRSLLSQLFQGDKPTPTPPPGLGYNPRNWNAVELLGAGRGGAGRGGLVPVDAPTDVDLGKLRVSDGFRFRLYHTPTGGDGDLVECGENWASLRALARFGGKPVDATGQVWRLSLKPGEPTAVWVQLAFDHSLPPTQNWPTLDSLGLRDALVP